MINFRTFLSLVMLTLSNLSTYAPLPSLVDFRDDFASDKNRGEGDFIFGAHNSNFLRNSLFRSIGMWLDGDYDQLF